MYKTVDKSLQSANMVVTVNDCIVCVPVHSVNEKKLMSYKCQSANK